MSCVRRFAKFATLVSFMSVAVVPALAHGGHCGGGGGHCGGHSFSHSCSFGHSHISSSSCHMHISGSHMSSFASMHNFNSNFTSNEPSHTNLCATNTEHAHVGFFRHLFSHSSSRNRINTQMNQVVEGNEGQPVPAPCFVMAHGIRTNRMASITAFMTTEATVSATAVTGAMKQDTPDFDVLQFADPDAGTITNIEPAKPAKMKVEVVPVQVDEEEQDESMEDADPTNSPMKVVVTTTVAGATPLAIVEFGLQP